MSAFGIADAARGVVEGVGNAVSGVARVFVGDKAARERQTHTENTAVLNEFTAEFAQTQRTWWDSLWNGLNRAPRPLMALSVLGLMVWCPLDPVGFTAAMQAYALVPLWLAGIATTIVGFYFTFRHLEKRLQMRGPSADQVRAVLDTRKAIREMGQPAAQLRPEPMDSDAFAAEMADTSKPLSNKAILEWNRRRKEGWMP